MEKKKGNLEEKLSEYFDKELGALNELQKDIKGIWFSGKLDFKKEKQITKTLIETVEAQKIPLLPMDFDNYTDDKDLVPVLEEITIMLLSDPIFLRLWLHNTVPAEEIDVRKQISEHIETKHEAYIHRMITRHTTRPEYRELPSTKMLKDTYENYLIGKNNIDENEKTQPMT